MHILLLAISLAFGGNVFIYVSKDKAQSCAPDAVGEKTIYKLSIDETTQAIRNYLGGPGTTRNPGLYDAALVNAGIKFCGDLERQAVFNFLLRSLDSPHPSRRVYELIANYGASKIMEEEIERELARPETSRAYRAHLNSAKKEIAHR